MKTKRIEWSKRGLPPDTTGIPKPRRGYWLRNSELRIDRFLAEKRHAAGNAFERTAPENWNTWPKYHVEYSFGTDGTTGNNAWENLSIDPSDLE